MRKRTILDRVLWMRMPTLETLSSELVNKRRKEHRHRTTTEAELVSLVSGAERTVLVTNVSKSGVGVESGEPLEVGSTVALTVTTTVMSG